MYMIFIVVLRFFDSRYKVSLTWDSNPRPSDFRSDALPTELAILPQILTENRQDIQLL